MGDIRAALREDYCKTGGCHPSHCVCGLAEDAADQIDALVKALEAVVRDVNDYERVNNLAPTPGHIECWDSVARAKQVLNDVGGEQ
jgi:hypothetical protein